MTTSIEAPGDPFIGKRLGRYELLHLIGIGAIGRVYQARSIEDEHFCAVKVLSREAAMNDALLDRFRREAIAMSKVSHPNVVGLLDFTGERDCAHLVMELVRGRTLSQLIHHGVRFGTYRVARLISQLAAGLSAIHAAGFVHRDLKPSNIMVELDSEGAERARILDLGMVGFETGFKFKGKRITDKGFTVGTASYMAPEQAFDAAVTHAADLYSLGIIAYEMVHGKVPERTLTGRPISVASPVTALDRILHRLREPLPSARPSTAALVVSELDRILPVLELEAPLNCSDPSELETIDIPEATTVPNRRTLK